MVTEVAAAGFKSSVAKVGARAAEESGGPDRAVTAIHVYEATGIRNTLDLDIVERSPREPRVGVENTRYRPTSGDFLKPAMVAVEDARRPDSIELEVVPHVVIGRRKLRLAAEWIYALVEVPVEIPGIVVLCFGEGVLAIDLESV